MTSYGAPFRMEMAKRKKFMTPGFLQAAIVGSGLLAVVIVLVSVPIWIDETTQLPHDRAATVPAETVKDLARIPEISLEDPLPRGTNPETAKSRIRNLINYIKKLNTEKQDGFLLAQIDRRQELRGLPFVMGDACRLPTNNAVQFQSAVTTVRTALDSSALSERGSRKVERDVAFWNSFLAGPHDQHDRTVAALTQILGPEQVKLRTSLAKHLASERSDAAVKALAKAAIFDSASEVRTEAIKALKQLPPEQTTDILMQGLRYPMPVVAGRAAVAMIELKRQDLYAPIVAFLAEPPPGDPVVNENDVCTVREVVRINHHRNCLMCHAPTSTGSTQEVPGVIPTPELPFPTTSREYYGDVASRGEPAVRADTTYLRQDFSVMMPVADAAPWPEMQRFDFLVRTRVVEGKELAALQQKVSQRAADFLSENHRAAVRVLRELSGQNAAPTSEAWRRVLGL